MVGAGIDCGHAARMIKIKRGPETAPPSTWSPRPGGFPTGGRDSGAWGGWGGPITRPGSDDNPRMQIRFTKMQGAGNDFVVLDETQGRLGLTAAHHRYLADRHFGVGAQTRSSPCDPSPAAKASTLNT